MKLEKGLERFIVGPGLVNLIPTGRLVGQYSGSSRVSRLPADSSQGVKEAEASIHIEEKYSESDSV